MSETRYTQNNNIDTGTLRISVIGTATRNPIKNAQITLSYSGEPDRTLEEVNTDESGNSDTLTLDTPPLELSMEPQEEHKLLQILSYKRKACDSKGFINGDAGENPVPEFLFSFLRQLIVNFPPVFRDRFHER